MTLFSDKKVIIVFNLLCILGLVYWSISQNVPNAVIEKVVAHLKSVRFFYYNRPILFISLFCATHVFCGCFSIPGSCTFLNITSGAVFGFKLGCVIVYPITMVSVVLGYLIGMYFKWDFFIRKYSKQISIIRKNFTKNDYFNFILLRLSPFLPFGVVNILMGFLKIPLGINLVTAFLGIFFDVVLLNFIGSSLLYVSSNSTQFSKKVILAGVFFALVFTFYLAKKVFRNKMTFIFND